jgi:hybrid cluster-associated redox disulfide protein
MKKVKGNMTFKEVMDLDSKAAQFLAGKGLFCGGCPFAILETIEQGCIAHGMDPKKVIKELNEKLEKEDE